MGGSIGRAQEAAPAGAWEPRGGAATRASGGRAGRARPGWSTPRVMNKATLYKYW